MTLSRFALTLVIGLSSGMLTYLMAAGMSLIISGMGIINFGQGAFYILGAYVCNQIFTAMGLPFGLALWADLWLPRCWAVCWSVCSALFLARI